MIDKDTKRSPWRLLCLLFLLLILALLLGFCSSDRFRNTVCNGICAPSTDTKVVVLMNKARRGGVFLESPYSKLFFKDDAGQLMTPHDAHWKRGADSKEYVKLKTRGLNPACYSEVDYIPPLLDDIALTNDDISIRVLDFGEDGSLETYTLNINPFDTGLANPVSPTKDGNYVDIQNYITSLTRNRLKHNGADVSQRIMPSQTPLERTPLHQGFDNNQNHRVDGYVYFYVLADERIKFVRDAPALYAHVPEHITTLYSPYFEYDVVPGVHNEQGTEPDILTLHFKRSANMVADVEVDADGNKNCRYPYDIAVISDGQSGAIAVETPLLIDPDTEVEGDLP